MLDKVSYACFDESSISDPGKSAMYDCRVHNLISCVHSQENYNFMNVARFELSQQYPLIMEPDSAH